MFKKVTEIRDIKTNSYCNKLKYKIQNNIALDIITYLVLEFLVPEP